MKQDEGPGTILDHDEAFAMLPWHVNGSLTEAEDAQVRSHLEDCAACRQEIATLNSLKQAVITSNEAVPEPAPAMLASLLNRIEDYEAARAATTHRESLVAGWRERLSVFWFSWSRVALAAQFAALLLLAVALIFTTQRARSFADRAASERARADHVEQLLKESQQNYETLAGRSEANRGTLAVAFQERATEKEIRELLKAINGTIVSGPSPQRMYSIALKSAEGPERERIVAAALNQLRTQPQIVLFAAEQP